jgi:hypothetical protein
VVRDVMRAAGHDNGCAGRLGTGVDTGRVKNRVCGRFLAALERVRHASRGGDLRSGLSHAAGFLIAASGRPSVAPQPLQPREVFLLGSQQAERVVHGRAAGESPGISG